MTDSSPFISQALGLAAQALFLSNPNPRVGCVITNAAGNVLGQGYTAGVGMSIGTAFGRIAGRNAAFVTQGREARHALA